MTFLDRIVRVARTAAAEVVLLGSTYISTPETSTLLRLEDETGSGGPLAGLVPLLRYVSDRWALLIACDMPLLETVLFQRLLNAREESTDAVVFHVADNSSFHVPCCGLFHPRVLTTAQSTLALGAGLRDLAQRIRTKYLDVNAAESHVLRGVNTPEELRHLIDNP
jgi:molybdopterin-guanine dinucleotide biosynthesis protein A